MRVRFGRQSVPLKGPAAIIFAVGMILFVVFFMLNFIFAIFFPELLFSIGIWFFFIPFGIMVIMVPTLMIYSIVTMVKGGNNPLITNQGAFIPQLNFVGLATKQGYTVQPLSGQDPSTAQYVLVKDSQRILFKSLPPRVPYTNGMVQDLSKGLVTHQATEAWIVQEPPTFIENDQNFARFYNVNLFNQAQAVSRLNQTQGQ